MRPQWDVVSCGYFVGNANYYVQAAIQKGHFDPAGEGP